MQESAAIDLGTVVEVSQTATAVTVIGGTVFAMLQLREFKRRQETAVRDLLRASMGPEFAEAMAIVTNLPDDLSAGGAAARQLASMNASHSS